MSTHREFLPTQVAAQPAGAGGSASGWRRHTVQSRQQHNLTERESMKDHDTDAAKVDEQSTTAATGPGSLVV